MIKYIAILSIALLSACTTTKTPVRTEIEIPDALRYGRCEKPIPKLNGKTGEHILRFATNAVNKVETCVKEKELLIELIDKSNKKAAKK